MAERRYLLERVDDAAVVQVYADGFTALSTREKLLTWHLYLAAIAGRDIYYDQRYAHNLAMRELLEGILQHAEGIDARVLGEIRRYTKLFWINTGPYNNLTGRKFLLQLTVDELSAAARTAERNGARFPLRGGDDVGAWMARLAPCFFDAAVDPIVTCKSPEPPLDLLQASANNLYAGVTLADLAGFTERYPLNSRLVKRDGVLAEEVCRVGGRYDRDIRRIVSHLRDALPYAAPPTADALRALMHFYETGEDADRIAYDIAWVRDQESSVDTINGFVEVYLDPRGAKGAWEGIVYYVDRQKTAKVRRLAEEAAWFEARMPWDPRFRKSEVVGISATAIEVVIETGDSGPITPVGINLPNDQAIRERYGSKSVGLANISDAYEASTPDALRTEFCWDEAEIARARRWSRVSHDLSTDLHEVIGHGSGRMAEGVSAGPHQLLGEHYSTLEETRADLVALYFIPDPKLAEIGLIAAADQAEAARAEYEYYARNALVQLRRVREGTQLEEDHMRNRQLIVHWLLAHTTAIEVRRRDGRTFYVVTDVGAFRQGAGQLLAEVQRIKSEGDAAAARALVDAYAVKFDPALRDEVVRRVDALHLPSYTGFVMPRLSPVRDESGAVVDVSVSYPCDLEAQMLEYSALARAASASDVLEAATRLV